MTDRELIQLTLSDPNASEVELELADRLSAAVAECDRLAQVVMAREVANGRNT